MLLRVGNPRSTNQDTRTGCFPRSSSCRRLRPMEMQDQYDDAMFDYTTGDYDSALAKFQQILAAHPEHFDAQLSVAMCHYRQGDFAKAIEEGHKAEKLKPNEQLVHTNLSLFYMKAGDKKTAEHHGLQARIASWRGNMQQPEGKSGEEED